VDTIEINGLRAPTRIGVPESERSQWQTVAIDVRMETVTGFGKLEDAIENTIDYFAVSQTLKEIAAGRPRKLIETLAEDLASCVLTNWPIARVAVTVRKFILADTENVSVSIVRTSTNTQR
jgi:dihydroneopterin aldolase